MNNDLLQNLEQLHTTELGIQRITKNLNLEGRDVVLWCKETIQNAEEIVHKGKNWYAYAGGIEITVNAHSFTIITAHKRKRPVIAQTIKDVEGPHTKEDLQEALRAIDSTIRKCEKAQLKLKKGTSSHTLLVRRIKAFQIAERLIKRELDCFSSV